MLILVKFLIKFSREVSKPLDLMYIRALVSSKKKKRERSVKLCAVKSRNNMQYAVSYIYKYIYIYIYIYIYMCVCVCVCVYIYILNFIRK